VLTHDTIGRTRHTLGTTAVEGARLPLSRVLVMEERSDGVFHVRHGRTGEFAGETWHASRDDAIHQAELEFGVSEGDWVEIPGDAPDAVDYMTREA
jgi:hypothetical protein